MRPSVPLLAVLLAVAVHAVVPPLRLQIVHLNDFHARFEPVSHTAGECKEEPCVGGLARVAAAVSAERARNPAALVLNAGDNFQGTLWFSLFRGNATAHFMKELPWDAMIIGNHEFDNGIDGLTPFLRSVKEQVPFVVANMDDSKEERMHGLWAPSVVMERDGHKVGVVGYIWKDTPTIARTERLAFGDELEALEREAALLRAQGVSVVVALSHAGIEVDLAVAARTRYADVIVGAHSHTLLYSEDPAPSGEHPYGPYPMVVRQSESGRTVLVVQASAYTKYLGNLTVQFDEDGEVQSWSGQPIFLSSDKPQDSAMVAEMEPWKAEVEALGLRVLGSSLVELDQQTHNCYTGECTLGNFVTDAMVDHYAGKGPQGTWTAAAISLTNAGGLRTNIEPGNVTYGDMVAAQPFANTVDLVALQGRHLRALLAETAESDKMLHWAGLRVEYDYALPAGRRVARAAVRCAACAVPRYGPVQDDAWYALAAPSYVLEGGDNYPALTSNFRNRSIGPVDIDVFEAYLASHSPLVTELDGRIAIRNAELAAVTHRRRLRGRRAATIFH